MGKARIIVLTGPGKGKTTSALGMMIRAVGRGKKVLLARFCKAAFSGELAVFEHVPGILVQEGPCGRTPPADHPEYQRHVTEARKLFVSAKAAAPEHDMIVMDEICGVVARGMIDEGEVVDFLKRLRSGQSAVLTGRGATPGLVEAADTVSEIRCVKHGYQQGIDAQEGIEF